MANIVHSIKQAIDLQDPGLVDNTPRLLEVLNTRADRLHKLLVRKDGRGYTLLHLAAERNQPESLKCLLIKEADPNSVSLPISSQVTPVHVAASLGHLACLQLLVKSGGDIMALDKDHKTPLDHARTSRQDLCINYLHEELGRKEAKETQEMVEVLAEVERHLAEDRIDQLFEWTLFNERFPLSLSAGSNLSPLENILYRHCDVSNSHEMVKVFGRLSREIPVHIHNASLLHCAARYGCLDLVQLLIERVPQIALSVSSEGYNALHLAVTHHRHSVTRLLVEKQVEWTRRTRRQASSEASVSGHPHPLNHHSLMERSGVENSLTRGVARFATPTMSGHTVLHFAVAVNNRESLSCLLKNHRELQLGVDCRECGYTPLHLAVFLNHSEAVRLLLKKNANPGLRLDQATASGFSICHTPMAEAVYNKSPEILGMLLEAGAEDRQHDAVKLCELNSRNRDLVVLLLASLVRQDDTYKPLRGAALLSGNYHRKQKHVMLSWENLSLTELLADWVVTSLPKVPLLQSVDPRRLFDCVTYVNLSKNKLRSVPKELFFFPHVVHLNLMDNLLEYLPELHMVANDAGSYIWPCHALSKLYLNRNCLVELPEFIFQLPGLVFLELSHNQIRELPFDLWRAPRLHTLLCSHNRLEAVPTNWPHVLTSCRVVEQEVPRGMESGSSDRSMSPNSPVTTQSKSKGGEDRETVEVTPLISKLHDRLNISNSNLPVSWDGGEGKDEDYEGLAILNLSYNAIRELPENLPCLCPKLVRLDLSHNQISVVCLPRCFPSELKQINMSYNQFVCIDSSVAMAKPLPCTNPQVLEEANNVLLVDNVSFCCHRNHTQLLRLMVLEITHCQLTSVNFCKYGIKIKQSSSTDPTKRPQPPPKPQPRDKKPEESLVICPILTRLILNYNQLTAVPMSVCEMKALNSLDLSHNDIIHLPAEMGNLSNLWEFPLAGLKLISPPQNIIERGKTKDIIGFLWSLLQRARPYHRMKLMLVGYANRGKTTLLEKLSEKGQTGVKDSWGNSRMQRSGKGMSTVGIVVSDWTYFKPVKESQTGLKSITFMTWDFGGQEEYYATHQCFLSRRSLYLAVWDVTHLMKGAMELKSWLINIQARAPNSPVIIVGTHYDKLNRSSDRQELSRCLDYITEQYGQLDKAIGKKDGFPQIMTSVVVSCTKGDNINKLRDTLFDVASQVRENLVAGRGIGAGRIPEYRLLMDQLVPASYLQLEDTIRNTAMKMKIQGDPPVLNYKELRREVFSDPNTLISKESGNRELEQAVRFLHDNGTMLHFEDPMLQNFYFVDPQWLCDVMAHVVTVREINPFIKDGIMLTKDFAHIFKEDNHRFKFPLEWKAEYIRLLTTFEVAVELSDDQLLVPSALPSERPVLHQLMLPDDVKKLPLLRHCYVVPFIPSGFWPRLMSRILTDPSFQELVVEGCALRADEHCQLSWVKWRTGLILQYGNLSLLTVSELDRRGIFYNDEDESASSNPGTIYILKENQWKPNDRERVYGVAIEAHDVYPILKFPEVRKKKRHAVGKRQRSSKVLSTEGPPSSAARVDVQVNGETTHEIAPAKHPSANLRIEQIDSEFAKMLKNRQGGRAGSGSSSLDGVSGRISPNPLRPRNSSDSSPDLPTAKPHDLSTSHVPVPPSHDPTPDPSPTEAPPTFVNEASNDKMRAGLLSKVIDHILLLMEDLYMGIREKHLIVPCPHCVCNTKPPTRMKRSFSDVLALLPDKERLEREVAERQERGVTTREGGEDMEEEEEEERGTTGRAAMLNSFSETGRTENEKHPQDSLSLSDSSSCKFCFFYNDCVVSARTLNTMYCPRHKELDLQYLTPDTFFLSYGREVAMETKDFVIKENIGRGAFAHVYCATYKDGKEVAIKAMTKEWQSMKGEWNKVGVTDHTGDVELEETDMEVEGGDRGRQHGRVQVKEPGRRSIVTGFENVKKELAILSPLAHPHVVRLFGVILRPIGMVLELAPKGSLKKILNHYKDVHSRFHVRAMQRVFLQLANAIHYLHEKSIIYRDLKTDNILVWSFPEPRNPIPIPLGSNLGLDTVLVKLSDYGISQYVAKQGALGYVGTPGFIAPEILKYHGKEAYDHKVDIFSFGMVIYEMLTLHIPYEAMAGQQANQANEQGKRPPLCRADFPCPVLARELMVWCWQQKPENRPTAPGIMEVATTEQFPRLLDGIRICNCGKVTSACSRTVMSSYLRRRESQSFSSPSYSATRQSGSRDNISSPQLGMVSEERDSSSNQLYPTPITDGWDMGVATWGDGGSNEALMVQGGRDSGKRGSGRGSDSGIQSAVRRDELTSSLTSRTPAFSSPSHLLQRQMSADDLSMKRVSPFSVSEEGEGPVWEVWVASSNAHHSTLSVLEYTHSFSSVEDIELGDSPVLCVCVVRKKVWLGLEAGVLVIYDANSRKPYLQSIVRHCKAIHSMLYVSPIHRVFLGLEDGSVLAFSDELPATPLTSIDPTITNPSLVNLSPVAQYRDSSQLSACFLALPTFRARPQDRVGKGSGAGENGEDKRHNYLSGEGLYELWVGQKETRITVLDASTLTVLQFLSNDWDKSKLPSYVDHLNCRHLVCSIWESDKGLVTETGGSGFVSVYSALYHGQYVTRWNARTKERVHCFDCRPHIVMETGGKDKKIADGTITALLFSKLELTVGLSCGLILILDPFSFQLLCTLSCHRQQVACLLSLQMSHAHPSSSRDTLDGPGSTATLPGSASQMSVRMSSSTGNSDKLLSFGTGFKSYYEEEDDKSKQKYEAGVLLVWESDHWRSCPNSNPVPKLTN